MTDAHGGGTGYELLDSGDYMRHSCAWNAAYTWCNKPMSSMRRGPDPTQTQPAKDCDVCKEHEDEDATAGSGSTV